MGNGCSTGHEDNEGSLASDEVDQQLQEGVDGEGLWHQYGAPCRRFQASLPRIRLAEDLHRRLR
jgi:hypothetical protein